MIRLRFQQDHTGCCVESGLKGSMGGNKEPSHKALAVTHGRGYSSWVQRGDTGGGKKRSSSGFILTFIDQLDVCAVYERWGEREGKRD